MSANWPLFDEEAERASIGAMLLEPERVVPLVTATLRMTPEFWHLPGHVSIVSAILSMGDGSRIAGIDMRTISSALRGAGKLDEIGGDAKLQQCCDDCPSTAHAEYYLDIVRQTYLRRRMIWACQEIEREAHEIEFPEDLIEVIPQRFASLAEVNADEITNEQRMDRFIDRCRKIKAGEVEMAGIPLPYEMVNRLACGLEPGLSILAARPSVGKTTLEDCISMHLAQKGIPVGRVTLDMDPDQVLARGLCRDGGVSLPKLKRGFATEAQLAQIAAAAEIIKTYPMYMTNRHRDITTICSWARAQHLRHGIRLLTVDFAQQVQVASMGTRGPSDGNARLTVVCSMLKALSFELEMPVLLLSQLSRSIEKEGREPQLSDLRDSGSLEQDASKVWFLYQDADTHNLMEQEHEGSTAKIRPVWMDLMKNQNGETGRLPLWLYASYFRFEEAADGFADWREQIKKWGPHELDEVINRTTARDIDDGGLL